MAMNQDEFLAKWEKGESKVLLDYTDIDCPACGRCMVGCSQCVCGWKRDEAAGPAFAVA